MNHPATAPKRARARRDDEGASSSHQTAQLEQDREQAREESCWRRKQKGDHGMSVFEQVLMGRLSLATLAERGMSLTDEQLAILQRMKHSY
ncbi:hypothetical protein HYH03_002066 [Edaphochlamys debaryana]|uniref:Uncharacterized protein n=1 Tax=Edaphochlamys debaryana TaxID=47281 RepID=A0A835YDM0_9CHLO|nr:hypothetical protein HYH03_002066 [Edaphochlamys debaryana]|eukprot:KAG2499769.1 hypothetical protein HYH03_002066 [Edaphochlamys debaryana]